MKRFIPLCLILLVLLSLVSCNGKIKKQLAGTYLGSDDSVLILFENGKATYYHERLPGKISTDIPWKVKDDRVSWLDPSLDFEVYATYHEEDPDNLVFVSDYPVLWDSESFRKVNSETPTLGADGCRKLVENAARVKEVTEAIDAIGKVTLDSSAKIEKARELYNKSNSTVKEQIENVKKLTDAEEKYEELVATSIKAAISNIGEVTLAKEATILKARNLYDDADKEVQDRVTNFSDLTAAEEKLDQLKISRAEELIKEAVGEEVTLDSEKKIADAERVYNALPRALKDRVENASALTEAQETVDRLKREKEEAEKAALLAEKDALIAQMYVKKDEIENDTTISPIPFKYNACHLAPIIITSSRKTELGLAAIYVGSEYLYLRDITVKADGSTYQHKFDYDSVKIDFGLYSCAALGTIGPIYEGSDEYRILEKVAASETAYVRFSSYGEYYDYTVTAEDKANITKMLKIYKALML